MSVYAYRTLFARFGENSCAQLEYVNRLQCLFRELTCRKILTQRPERAVLALAELCREREDELQRAPRSSSPAPRALSATRGNFTSAHVPGTWRSHSQAPFDRFTPSGVHEPHGRRGDDDIPEYSAQDLWLQSQGANLGGVQVAGLGFGFDDLELHGARGRDTVARGLDTPSGAYRNGPSARRSASAYEGNSAPTSGTISAPLSPQRMYAQLELGKGIGSGLGSQQLWASYDPRLHASAGMPMSMSGPSSLRSQSQQGTSRSVSGPNIGVPASAGGSLRGRALAGVVPSSSIGIDSSSPLHAFAPFDAAPIPSPSKAVGIPAVAPAPGSKGAPGTAPHRAAVNTKENGSAVNFISPSTLLSPSTGASALPETQASGMRGMDALAGNFGQLNVSRTGTISPPPKMTASSSAGIVGGKTEHPDPAVEKRL